MSLASIAPTAPSDVIADPQQFRDGMRLLAAGVSLITTAQAGVRHGLVATSVTSLVGDPASLLVCVNRISSAHAPISLAGAFCVNLLGVQHQALAGQFSNSERRHERFVDGDWHILEDGIPVLEDAIASFICRLDRIVDHFSHSIFIAVVTEVRIGKTISAPLLYFDRKFAGIETAI